MEKLGGISSEGETRVLQVEENAGAVGLHTTQPSAHLIVQITMLKERL